MEHYNFQDYLKLTIETNGKRQFKKYFDNEYSRIDNTNVAKKAPAYAVTLKIVDTIPEDLPKDAIVRSARFKKLFTFEYAITGLGTKDAVVYFKDHPVRKIYVTAVGVFVQAQVLEPVMYLSFLRQGILFMHSAGVSKDGNAYVFPAYGGTGKTTTSMTLMAKGYQFLGDDLLIVDPKKKLVFPYPRPLHIFTYNVRNLNGAKIPATTAGIIYFKNVLRFFLERILRTEFLISTRVHADEILPDMKLSDPAKLHNVVFLKKKGDHEYIPLKTKQSIAEHAENVVVSADLNVSLFDIIQDDALQKGIREEEITVAGNIISNAQAFGYLNTRLIDLEDAPKYIEDPASL